MMGNKHLVVLFLLVAICAVQGADDVSAYAQTNCTVILNDCARNVDKTCHCWVPECQIHPEEFISKDCPSGCCPPGTNYSTSCTPDECGTLYEAKVLVTLTTVTGEKKQVNSTVYGALHAGSILTQEQASTFLEKYQEGSTHVCWYDVDRVYQVYLEPSMLCHLRGTYNPLTQKCTCEDDRQGTWCESIRNTPPETRTRTYYMAAQEIEWDYAPSNMDKMTQLPLSQTTKPMHSPKLWTMPSENPPRIGKVYKKAVYKEYEDALFKTEKVRDKKWEHLGILGPVIRAEVGDTIKVVFFNNASRPYSVHPHGVLYSKESEGSGYMNGKGNNGNAVNPQDIYIYTWEVPERAGPGPADPSSICWMYHSHIDEAEDTNSGLVGPIIISRRGSADSDGKPRDVDTELVALFMMFDEGMGWYLRENMLKIPNIDPKNTTTFESIYMKFMMDLSYKESNYMYAINGFVYGNGGGFNATVNETVRWYIIALGTHTDVHGAHWHGNTLIHKGSVVDSIDLMPSSMKTLDMVPDMEGEWMFHCHTNHHIHGGMATVYNILPCVGSCGNSVNTGPDVDSSDHVTVWPMYVVGIILSLVCITMLAWWYRRGRKAKKGNWVNLETTI